jgi:hypothetical protein
MRPSVGHQPTISAHQAPHPAPSVFLPSTHRFVRLGTDTQPFINQPNIDSSNPHQYHWPKPMAMKIGNPRTDMDTQVRTHAGSYPPWQISHNVPLNQKMPACDSRSMPGIGLHTIKSFNEWRWDCCHYGPTPITSPIINSNHRFQYTARTRLQALTMGGVESMHVVVMPLDRQLAMILYTWII